MANGEGTGFFENPPDPIDFLEGGMGMGGVHGYGAWGMGTCDGYGDVWDMGMDMEGEGEELTNFYAAL